MMAKITALSPQQKDPNRYNLFIDGVFYCGVSLNEIDRFQLKVDSEIDETTLDLVFRASEFNKLYQRALDYLARRPRSEREMRDYLKEKFVKRKLVESYSSEELGEHVDSLIERMKRNNYINDAEFVDWWIDQRTQKVKPSGWRRIESELIQKGVDRQTIKRGWQKNEIDETDLILKHYETIKNKYVLDDRKDRDRLVRYFQNKGFHWDKVKNLLTELSQGD